MKYYILVILLLLMTCLSFGAGTDYHFAIPIVMNGASSGTTAHAYATFPYRGEIISATVTLTNCTGTPTCTVKFSDNTTTGTVGTATGENYWISSAVNENAETMVITPGTNSPVPILSPDVGTTYVKFALSSGVTFNTTIGYFHGVCRVK